MRIPLQQLEVNWFFGNKLNFVQYAVSSKKTNWRESL